MSGRPVTPPKVDLFTTTRHTVSLTEAARQLGIGRDRAYALARAGEFPTPVITVGDRMVVSTIHLRKVLGIDPPAREQT